MWFTDHEQRRQPESSKVALPKNFMSTNPLRSLRKLSNGVCIGWSTSYANVFELVYSHYPCRSLHHDGPGKGKDVTEGGAKYNRISMTAWERPMWPTV